MKYKTLAAVGLLLVIVAVAVLIFRMADSDKPPCGTAEGDPCPTPTADSEGWTLMWSDEFDGDSIDRSNWTFDVGGEGWGNNELEYYTDRPENVRVEDGALVIEAREEDYRNRQHTSARLKTQGLQSWTFGKIEARIQVPDGQGIWPAFWMLGDDIEQVSWPDCGEIDIMEHIGSRPTTVHGTLHGPGYSGGNGIGRSYRLSEGAFSDNFHVFGIEWEPEQISWFVDGEKFETILPTYASGEWVFDHPFFIILNVAVGGNWPGYPDETTVFPQFMYVDWVRVYQKLPAP